MKLYRRIAAVIIFSATITNGPLAAQEAGFIEVSGSASLAVAPDVAFAHFTVETKSKTAAEASGTNADLMDAVVSAVRGADFLGLKIETFGYSLRPEYRPGDAGRAQSREIDGYTASNNIRITINDVTAAGRLIDVAIANGANRVAQLGFSASDTEQARATALAQATANARREAEIIAEALGRLLGPPLEVRGSAPLPTLRPMGYGSEIARMAAPTPIAAGDQTVRANVSIRFALGPPRSGR